MKERSLPECPSVLLVVPTHNSARTLERCLLALRSQRYLCRIVVVDNFSSDQTPEVANRLADECITAGPERSHQRNLGARSWSADVVGFVDSDMILEPLVVREAVERIADGAGAVIVPERTVGEGFWASVRAFERAFYVGDDGVEAARFFHRAVLEATGGFDERLNAGEDWDLTIRARQHARVARIAATLDHDEGHVRYRDDCRKKAAYALGIRAFAAKHGLQTLQRVASRRYLREPWRLVFPHPLLGAGVISLKAGEVLAVTWALLGSLVSSRSQLARRIWHRSGKLAFVRAVDAVTNAEVPHRYRWASSWAGSLDGKRIADVGCWTGGFLEYLASVSQAVELVGIDLAGPWLEEARLRHPEMSFIPVESLLSPPGKDLKCFDTVFLLETLEHVERGSERRVLENLAKLLAPSGEIILSTPAAGLAAITDPAWLLVGHRHYSRRRLVELCGEAGLVIRGVAYSGNLWSLLDVNLLYAWKHIVRRQYHPSPYISELADTSIYSVPRTSTNNIWIRASRRVRKP